MLDSISGYKTHICCALLALLEVLNGLGLLAKIGVTPELVTMARGILVSAGGIAFRLGMQKTQDAAEAKS